MNLEGTESRYQKIKSVNILDRLGKYLPLIPQNLLCFLVKFQTIETLLKYVCLVIIDTFCVK